MNHVEMIPLFCFIQLQKQLLTSIFNVFLDTSETLDPEVKILSLAIKSTGRPDIVLPIPENGNPKGLWFTLKEGSLYRLVFTFQVNNNIVSGLKYTNTVWKTGIKGKFYLSHSLISWQVVVNRVSYE